MQTSKLQWHPRQYHTVLWEVLIDGELFSDCAQPFSASDELIERYGCTSCGTPCCSWGFISVRRAAGKVLWFAPMYGNDLFGVSPGLGPQKYLCFEAEHYQLACGSGNVVALSEISTREIVSMLCAGLPQPSLAVAIDPPIDDGRGERLLGRLHQVLDTIGISLEAGPPPPSWAQITIHLDIPGLPEARWCIGKTDTGVAVLFEELPRLPFWVYGQAFDQVFEQLVSDL